MLIKELDAIDDNRAVMIVANWEFVQEKCELEVSSKPPRIFSRLPHTIRQEMGRIFWKHLNDVVMKSFYLGSIVLWETKEFAKLFDTVS